MDRDEWLKAVYGAACRVAEKHGRGLRAAVESRDDDGRLAGEVGQVAAETIAASRALWPFIVYSAHPEPPGADWRAAPSFEGAAVRVAVAALAADIRDLLEGLAVRGGGWGAPGPAPKGRGQPGRLSGPEQPETGGAEPT
jgi:hypothetical protein